MLVVPGAVAAPTFRVATFNVENYLDEPTPTRHAKSPEAKAKVRESILALTPDVLALQEIGNTNALEELRTGLKVEGLDLPYADYLAGSDTNVHLAILSRFPFSVRHHRTNDQFLVGNRRFHVSRGFAELAVQVTTNYSFTLLTAHLKSKRPVPQAEETELRLQEAKLLREEIDACFANNPQVNLVVLGDFNDTPDAVSTKAIIGRGRHKLIDTRPAERNGDSAIAGAKAESRNITWTHYFPREDSYSRIDYILLSPGMAREWLATRTYVLALPNWGVASDHRPLVAEFEAEDK